jgi:predicted secreted protein
MSQISENDNGRDVMLASGETLDLALPETSGTGFKWDLVSNGEPAVLLESDYVSSSKAPGSARMHRWRFRAQKSGAAKLELAYRRSWQTRPARVFTVNIRVEPRP